MPWAAVVSSGTGGRGRRASGARRASGCGRRRPRRSRERRPGTNRSDGVGDGPGGQRDRRGERVAGRGARRSARRRPSRKPRGQSTWVGAVEVGGVEELGEEGLVGVPVGGARRRRCRTGRRGGAPRARRRPCWRGRCRTRAGARAGRQHGQVRDAAQVEQHARLHGAPEGRASRNGASGRALAAERDVGRAEVRRRPARRGARRAWPGSRARGSSGRHAAHSLRVGDVLDGLAVRPDQVERRGVVARPARARARRRPRSGARGGPGAD